jgi:HPt (histidine-containing phosphotransfer) domain-containing protein
VKPPSAGDPGDVIDRAHLEQLGARFGAPFVVQLIDLFISQGHERMSAAQQAAAAGDAKAVSAAAHALKSSAGNLGAVALASRAADVERTGNVEQPTAMLGALVSDLERAFEDACAALQSVRSASGGANGGSR